MENCLLVILLKKSPADSVKGEGERQNAGTVKVICFYMSMKPYYYCFTCQQNYFCYVLHPLTTNVSFLSAAYRELLESIRFRLESPQKVLLEPTERWMHR